MGDNRHPICCVEGCGVEGVHKMHIRKRGNESFIYMCDYHFNTNERYSSKNGAEKGKEKKNGDTFSIELEVSDHTKRGRFELTSNGFLPTSDSSVQCKFKSPIYKGMNAFVKYLTSIEDLVNTGDIEIDESCGTHIHIGSVGYMLNGVNYPALDANTYCFLQNEVYYYRLFKPLQKAIEAEMLKSETFFGRYFNHYADKISVNVFNHYNFINVEDDEHYTIEFRLPVFKTKTQYAKCAHFCRDVMHDVQKYFLVDPCVSTADKAANMIVKHFYKYLQDI